MWGCGEGVMWGIRMFAPGWDKVPLWVHIPNFFPIATLSYDTSDVNQAYSICEKQNHKSEIAQISNPGSLQALTRYWVEEMS
jgi:hypothetical protein